MTTMGNMQDETDNEDEGALIEVGATCAACGGPLTLLGHLGKVVHYRCRDCGMDSHRPSEPDENYKKYVDDMEAAAARADRGADSEES